MTDGKNKSLKDILRSLAETQPGTHSIIVYPDLQVFREIYANYAKQELESNQIVLMMPHYETVDNIVSTLSKIGINVQESLQEGSLLIIDSHEAFFDHQAVNEFHDNEKGNIVSLLRILQTQAKKLKKDGITVIVDLGCFFPESGQNELMRYEKSIPQIFRDSTLKQLCMYHQQDFDIRFNHSEKATLLDHHGRSIIMIDV